MLSLMYVKRYILLAVAAVVPVTWGMIALFPRTNFIQHALTFIGAGTVAVAVIATVAVLKEDELDERGKTILMAGLLIAILVPTIYTASSFVHRSQTSWSGGEVHYHADYEVIVQDEDGSYNQLDLIDPSRFCERTQHESPYMCKLNDRTGATEYHEHNDRRIHLEGNFREREDATLAAFFETFGGELSDDRLVYPTNDRVWNLTATEDRHLSIVLKRGTGGTRGYCLLEDGFAENITCRNSVRHGGDIAGTMATSPAEYIISPWQQPATGALGAPLDQIWIVYSNETADQVLRDLREDDGYKRFTFEKAGEGY